MNDIPGLELGPTIEATPDRQITGRNNFEEALRLAELGGDHLWVAITSYLIKDPTQKLFLDIDNIAGPPMLGCFRCEEDYTPQLAKRRCKGTAKWEKIG